MDTSWSEAIYFKCILLPRYCMTSQVERRVGLARDISIAVTNHRVRTSAGRVGSGQQS